MRRPCRRIAFSGPGLSRAIQVRNLIAMNTHYRVVLSPCIGICDIEDDGLCAGCHRTGVEIANWTLLNDDARLRMMDEILPQRAAQRGTQ